MDNIVRVSEWYGQGCMQTNIRNGIQIYVDPEITGDRPITEANVVLGQLLLHEKIACTGVNVIRGQL